MGQESRCQIGHALHLLGQLGHRHERRAQAIQVSLHLGRQAQLDPFQPGETGLAVILGLNLEQPMLTQVVKARCERFIRRAELERVGSFQVLREAAQIEILTSLFGQTTVLLNLFVEEGAIALKPLLVVVHDRLPGLSCRLEQLPAIVGHSARARFDSASRTSGSGRSANWSARKLIENGGKAVKLRVEPPKDTGP